jgi:hypothetical protein
MSEKEVGAHTSKLGKQGKLTGVYSGANYNLKKYGTLAIESAEYEFVSYDGTIFNTHLKPAYYKGKLCKMDFTFYTDDYQIRLKSQIRDLVYNTYLKSKRNGFSEYIINEEYDRSVSYRTPIDAAKWTDEHYKEKSVFYSIKGNIVVVFSGQNMSYMDMPTENKRGNEEIDKHKKEKEESISKTSSDF